MMALLEGAVVLGFPALAVWALRRGGGRRLWLVTAGGLALIAAVALVVAADRFGNRLAAQYGYGHIAVRMLLLAALLAGLPILGSALSVSAARRRITAPVALYALGAVTAVVALVFGTILALYLLPALV
jgi:hypothetical protein